MKVGIDIGGSHIAIASVNDKGEIIQKLEQDIIQQKNMTQYILNYVDNGIEKLSQAGDIEEIGIATPGNPKGTSLTNLVNLNIELIDFKPIERKYQIKIKTINDGKAAAMAEKEYGAMRGYRDGVFLCLGTGIGGAVFINNELLRANRNPGFELGHMIINKDGKECKCGKKGCFETYCSIKRFKDEIKQVLEEIEPNVKITNALEIKEVLQKYIENSKIQECINQYIDNLIIGLSNIIDIFEPEVICLGGSFVYFKEILYDKLVAQMDERKYVFNKQGLPKIVLAELKNDAGIIGATLIK